MYDVPHFRYSMIKKCFASETNFRPSFTELVELLSGLLDDTAGYLDLVTSI